MKISQDVYDAIEKYMVDEEIAIKVDLRNEDTHTAQFVDKATGVTHDVLFYMSEENDYIEHDFA